MSSAKVTNAISAFVHEEKLAFIKDLKVFLEEKMDNADDITDIIDEFTSTLIITKTKISKNTSSVGNTPKRTRKPTFYNHWLGERLRSFGGEQKLLPEEERVPKSNRMKIIANEWSNFKNNPDEYDDAKTKWEESSSGDEPVKKPKKKKKKDNEVKSKKKLSIHDDSGSGSGSDSEIEE